MSSEAWPNAAKNTRFRCEVGCAAKRRFEESFQHETFFELRATLTTYLEMSDDVVDRLDEGLISDECVEQLTNLMTLHAHGFDAAAAGSIVSAIRASCCPPKRMEGYFAR